MANKPWITQKGMRWTFWMLVMILILTIGLCIGFYPGKYLFFKQTISSLGHFFASNGDPNTISQKIFTAGFLVLGVGTLFMMIAYTNVRGFYGAGWKVITLFIFFFGAVGTAFPADHLDETFRMYHIIGAALFVTGFGLFNFVSQLLRFIRKHTPIPKKGAKKWDFYVDLVFVILVFLAIFAYLVSGLIGFLPYPNIAEWIRVNFVLEISQKILLFIGCIAAFLLDVDDM
jgi:hypothetical protein